MVDISQWKSDSLGVDGPMPTAQPSEATCQPPVRCSFCHQFHHPCKAIGRRVVASARRARSTPSHVSTLLVAPRPICTGHAIHFRSSSGQELTANERPTSLTTPQALRRDVTNRVGVRRVARVFVRGCAAYSIPAAANPRNIDGTLSRVRWGRSSRCCRSHQ